MRLLLKFAVMLQLQGLFTSTLQCYFFLMKTRDSWVYLCSFIIITNIIIIFFIYFTFYFHCFIFFLCVAQVMVVLFLYSVLITVAGPTGQTVERTNRWSSEGEVGGATANHFDVCPCVAVRRRTEDLLRRRHPGTASSRVGGVKVSCCCLSKSNAKLTLTPPPHPNHHHLVAKKTKI